MSQQLDGVLSFCTQHRHTFPIVAKLGRDGWEAARATGIFVVWRRVPITTVTIALVTAFWLYDYVSISPAAASTPPTSGLAVEYVPPVTTKPLPESHPSNPPTTTGRAHNTNAVHSAFRRKRIGQSEVDYVAEDVTIRLFTPNPTATQVPRLSSQRHTGTDAPAHYSEHGTSLAPHTRPGSATAQFVDHSLLVSK